MTSQARRAELADGLQPGPSDEATDALLADAEAQARAALAGRDAGEPGPADLR